MAGAKSGRKLGIPGDGGGEEGHSRHVGQPIQRYGDRDGASCVRNKKNASLIGLKRESRGGMCKKTGKVPWARLQRALNVRP